MDFSTYSKFKEEELWMKEKLHQTMRARRTDARVELLTRMRMVEEVVMEMEMEGDD